MKKLWISIVLPIFLITGIYSQESFLHINGFVETTEGESISGATAAVYIGNSKVNSISTGADGGFSFKLDFGKEYRLIVSKPGMIQKRIDFNTNISPDLQKKYVNDFAMTLTKDCQGASTDVFNEPIDIISFEEGEGNFVSNRAHFQKMQSRVAAAFTSIEKCIKDQFDEKKDAADAAFKAQNFEEARKLYQEALEIIPGNSAAKKQLSQIDKSIKQKAQNEGKYAELIKEADQMAAQGQLNGAKAKYEQAAKLKPGDTYSQNKAQEINNQLASMAQEAQAKKQLDQQYNGIVARANSAMAQKNYEEAKKLFEEAKTLKPAEAFPAQKLAEAQRGLEKQEQENLAKEAKDKAYADAMAKGQEAMQKGDFIGAQALFQQALAQKPDASEPRKIIAEAQKLEEQRKKEEIRAKREELDRQFNELIQKADGLLDQKEYDQAIVAYKEAIELKSSDKYANTQLNKAKNIKIEVEQQKLADIEKTYEDALIKGDALQLQQKFEEAIAAYQAALVAKPSDAKANAKIAEAQKLLVAQQAKIKEETENKGRFNQLVQEGDALFQGQQYPESKAKYAEALSIYPTEAYPKNQVTKVENILAKQAKEDEYNTIIGKADNAFNEQRLDEARAFYSQAQLVIPEKSYPAQKLNEITELQSKLAKQEVQAKYDKLAADAETAITQNNYDAAKQLYSQAGLLMPDNPFPPQRINEINALIDEFVKQQKDEKYNEVIAQADGLFDQQQLEQAKQIFQRAATEFPDKQYPKNRINEINQLIGDLSKKEKQAEYDKLTADAETAVTQNNYDAAKQLYTQAGLLMPDNPYPSQRINEINALIDQYAKQQKDEKYNEVISQADGLFDQQQLKQAKQIYQRAATEFPDKQYPKNRINEINQLIGDLSKQEKQAEYDKLTADAETAVTQNNYDAAKQLYSQAGLLMPDNPYPAQRINEINALIDQYARQKKDEKFNEVIAQADGLFDQQQLDQAKQIYQRAVTEFPDKQYPKDKINEINKLMGDLSKQGKQAEFDKLVADAETAVGNEAYDNAKQYLAQAAKVLPKNPYPQRRINEINALIDNKAKNTEEEAYNKFIAQADGLFNEEKYIEAKAVYVQARLKMPENSYPNEKINEINQILSRMDREKVTERYNSYIAEADQLFENESYQEARFKYQQAARVVPENTYPQQRINDINTILAAATNAQKEEQEAQKRYDDAIKLGDKYFSDKNYSLAKGEYSKALSVFSSESYPKEQIAKSDELIAEQQRLLAEQQALNSQVREAINAADTYFRDKQLPQAKEFYQKALDLKPSHVHASSQIQRIDVMLDEQDQATKAKEGMEKQYNDFITNADAKFKANDFQTAKKSYMAAHGLKPNESYPKVQIKKIDDMLLAMTSKKPVNNVTQNSNNTKVEEFKFKNDSEKKAYLDELKKKYSPGVTCEIYKEGNKTTKRYIVYREGQIHEYREIYFTWGGKSFTYDGKPTNAFHVQKNVKPKDGEAYSEKKM